MKSCKAKLVFLFLAPACANGVTFENETRHWQKHPINSRSVFEGAGVADFDSDGDLDVFSGNSWYEAPHWRQHRVRQVATSPNPHYREDFADLPLDVNLDGRPDIVTCNYFDQQVTWVENPSDPTRPWIEHLIDTPGPSETGRLVDINGDGRIDFLPNMVRSVIWYQLVQQQPQVVWIKHELGTDGAGHGVGTGDLNGDGRTDILTPKGWYQQPDEISDSWKFHPEFDLGNAGISILGWDIDFDGKEDVLWGMGHDYGLYWLDRGSGSRNVIDASFSQVHTLTRADLDGDGKEELITGKRVYAHEVEPGATDALCIYWFDLDRKTSKWTRNVVYEGQAAVGAPKTAQERQALQDFPLGSAGTGLDIVAQDLDGDGDTDLICPGKTGLYWFENLGV